jgi:hypothetical protein
MKWSLCKNNCYEGKFGRYFGAIIFPVFLVAISRIIKEYEKEKLFE